MEIVLFLAGMVGVDIVIQMLVAVPLNMLVGNLSHRKQRSEGSSKENDNESLGKNMELVSPREQEFLRIIDSTRVFKALKSSFFSLDDIKELCFLMSIDWDELEGYTKSKKALALVSYCRAHNRLHELSDLILEARPNIDFEKL